MPDRQSHWDTVYTARPEHALTWFQASHDATADLIDAFVDPGQPILDVGGGASRLVDALLAKKLGPLTVLDLSPHALATTRARLGSVADKVNWVAHDITTWTPTQTFALWHDRAVFHFLTDAPARAAYVARLTDALAPGGTAIISTFALDGPEKCSGLPVVRYAPETLAAEIEKHATGDFTLHSGTLHDHVTPMGNIQKFQTTILQRS